MASAYHRRPVVEADDIAALTVAGIGSGVNLYGYYMFHGGANPQGALSTLEESQATGYPNDLPQIDYDFNAPLGEFGQERESYRKTRLLHLFLNVYGSELAPMAAFAPAMQPRDAADTTTPRIAVRSDGSSGFIFVNNYVRQLAMPARPGFQVKVRLAGGELRVPAKAIDVPANTYFVWPFQLALDRAKLRYSTAQLLTRLDVPGGKLVVFFAVPGVAPEFCFDATTLGSISAPGAVVLRSNGIVMVSKLEPGMNAKFELTDSADAKTTVLLLTQQQAEQTNLLRIANADHLALSASSLFFDGDRLHLRSTASPAQEVAVLPDVRFSGARSQHGLWTT